MLEFMFCNIGIIVVFSKSFVLEIVFETTKIVDLTLVREMNLKTSNATFFSDNVEFESITMNVSVPSVIFALSLATESDEKILV